MRFHECDRETLRASTFMKQTQSIFNRPDRIRTIAYWTFTLAVAFENAAGAMWVFLRVEYPRLILLHLGYPQYIQYILGPWNSHAPPPWLLRDFHA
jgi:hypothetical protein